MTTCAEDPSTTVVTRRTMLRTVVGGFALAASGLVLPNEEDLTEAREGALDGDRGGRRGKDHKGQHRRRSHGNRKDKGQRRNGGLKDHGPFRAAALTVTNQFGIINGVERPVICVFYYRIKTGLDAYGPAVADKEVTLHAGESFRYDPDRYRVGVLCKRSFDTEVSSDDVYADVRNVSLWYPRGGVTTGPDLDPAAGKIGNSTLIREQDFTVDETHFDSRGRIGLSRVDDSDNRIEWKFFVS